MLNRLQPITVWTSYMYYGRKKIELYKKVGRKQNVITFFLFEIEQKLKQVWIGHGKGLSEIKPVKAYTP